MTTITYSSQVLPACLSAKRQLAMLKESYGTMVTAVAIVLRRQGFMAEEHDGNILISCGGRLYAALHFLRLELQGRQVVALHPSVDVTTSESRSDRSPRQLPRGRRCPPLTSTTLLFARVRLCTTSGARFTVN